MSTNGHHPITSDAILLKSAVDANPAAWPEMMDQMREQVRRVAPRARFAKDAASWLCSGCKVIRNDQVFDFPEEHYHLRLDVL